MRLRTFSTSSCTVFVLVLPILLSSSASLSSLCSSATSFDATSRVSRTDLMACNRRASTFDASGSAASVSVSTDLSRPLLSVIQPGRPSFEPTSGALRQSMLDSERMSELRAVFGNHPDAVRLAANAASSSVSC